MAALAAGCAVTPADQDPVQIKLSDLDARLARVERVIQNQSLLDMANQVEALRSDVRAMHNDIDVINHNLEAARKQQRDLYADLDQRVKALEARGAVVAPASAAGAEPVDDKSAYQAAFDQLKSGQYDRAITSFQNFLTNYPNSAMADNAQYWLGEAHYVNKSYPDALAAFKRVLSNFPDSRKVPDALLKIGYCDYEMQNYAAARDALLQVSVKYPDSPSAPLARQRLDKMAAEKH